MERIDSILINVADMLVKSANKEFDRKLIEKLPTDSEAKSRLLVRVDSLYQK